jgi:hypothetical protein
MEPRRERKCVILLAQRVGSEQAIGRARCRCEGGFGSRTAQRWSLVGGVCIHVRPARQAYKTGARRRCCYGPCLIQIKTLAPQVGKIPIAKPVHEGASSTGPQDTS